LGEYSKHTQHSCTLLCKKVFVEKIQWNTWPLVFKCLQTGTIWISILACSPSKTFRVFQYTKSGRCGILICINNLLQFFLRIYIAWKGRLLPIKHIFPGRVSAKIVINKHACMIIELIKNGTILNFENKLQGTGCCSRMKSYCDNVHVLFL